MSIKKSETLHVRTGPARESLRQDIEILEFEEELSTSADTVLGIIEGSRSKMTNAERESADLKADAILKSASENA